MPCVLWAVATPWARSERHLPMRSWPHTAWPAVPACQPAAVGDVVALLRRGQANRRVAETNTNERSSRSYRRGQAWARWGVMLQCSPSCTVTAVATALLHCCNCSAALHTPTPFMPALHGSLAAHATCMLSLGTRVAPPALQRVHLLAAEQGGGRQRRADHQARPAAPR